MIWPIERHLIEFKEKYTQDSESVFVAPSIYPDSQSQIDYVKYKSAGKNVIRPYKIADFVDFLESAIHLYAV